MKQGKSIIELATEIARQNETKRDYVADTRAIEMQINATRRENGAADAAVIYTPHLVVGNGSKMLDMPLRDLAHEQVAARLDIPRAYYKRMMATQPHLLAQNVNTWMKATQERRMVRTLDGNVRAFLSDKFRPLENADLAEAVLPVLADLKVKVISADITERRLYIKALDESIMQQLPTGVKLGDHVKIDCLCPAITISNSEVGAGALSVESGVWTEGCANLLIMQMAAMRKYHVGARADIGEEVYAILSDSTKRVSDAAVWMQVRDIVKSAFEKARFDAFMQKLAGTTQQKIEGDPVKAIELTAKHFSMSESERGSVLSHLIKGGDLSRYGLLNAITRTAEDLSDYDRATEFERFGGNVIELPRNDWQRIADAGKEKIAA